MENTPALGSNIALQILGSLSGEFEGQRDRRFGFVKVGHVVDKAKHLTGVNEPQGGAIACGDNGGMANAV